MSNNLTGVCKFANWRRIVLIGELTILTICFTIYAYSAISKETHLCEIFPSGTQDFY